MNLYDPQRPQIGSKPTYLNATTVIQPPQILPSQTIGDYDVRMMLPVKEWPGMASKYFHITFTQLGLLEFLYQFRDDPELCVETWLSEDFFTPDVRRSNKPPATFSDFLEELI